MTVEKTIQLRNAGTAELRILALNFEIGAGAADFAVPASLLDSLPLVVAPGAETTLPVTYKASDGTTNTTYFDATMYHHLF